MRGVRLLAVVGLVAGLRLEALAQNVRATLAPVTSVTSAQVLPSGHRFNYCRGGRGMPAVPYAAEYEVLIENDQDTQQVVTFDIDVRAGQNGNYWSLNCPPIVLPASVNPVTDVSCSTSTHQLQVRNIVIPACGRERLRFTVNPDLMLPNLVDTCMGGSVAFGASSVRTASPLTDQVPQPTPASDTCVFWDGSCGPAEPINMRHEYTMTDENGPPLRPGDFVTFRATVDFRKFQIGPPQPNEVYFSRWYGAVDGTGTWIPIPAFITFLNFTATGKPFEAAGIVYEHNAGLLRAYDPDPNCPPTCTRPIQLTQPTRTLLVEWRGQVNCSAPIAQGQCALPHFEYASSWGTTAFLGGDDPQTYADIGDATCAVPLLPDLSTSTKTLEDADRDGEASPGELITFSINVTNSLDCPATSMSCECRATDVVVLDSVDQTVLDPATINVLNGGVLTPPNLIRWDIPSIAPRGQTGETQVVQFQARVRNTARNNDQVCNTATIQASEFVSTTQGGKSPCATVPPLAVTTDPCLTVRIPLTAKLAVEKSIEPPTGPYVVGQTVRYSVRVSNVGGAPASNVTVTDTLDADWCSTCISNISDSGTYNAGAPATVSWPPLGSLAAAASYTYTFDARIPVGLADQTLVSNTASARSTEVTTPVPSNQVDFLVCAPSLNFTKVADQAVYQEGDLVTWTISVSNPADCAATNVRVRDTIDVTRIDEATLVWTPSTGTWDSVAKTYTWPALASLSGNSSQTVQYTIQGRIRSGTSGTQVCNTGRASWDQGLTEISTSPTTGTCSDIGGGPTCQVSALSRVTLVKGAKSGADALFSWPALSTPPPEYHLNSVTAKVDIPSTATCTPGAGSKRAACGNGVARDTQSTPMGRHVNAVPDLTPLFFYQVYAACQGSGDFEGPF